MITAQYARMLAERITSTNPLLIELMTAINKSIAKYARQGDYQLTFQVDPIFQEHVIKALTMLGYKAQQDTDKSCVFIDWSLNEANTLYNRINDHLLPILKKEHKARWEAHWKQWVAMFGTIKH